MGDSRRNSAHRDEELRLLIEESKGEAPRAGHQIEDDELPTASSALHASFVEDATVSSSAAKLEHADSMKVRHCHAENYLVAAAIHFFNF
jgi:hypothetical protein